MADEETSKSPPLNVMLLAVPPDMPPAGSDDITYGVPAVMTELDDPCRKPMLASPLAPHSAAWELPCPVVPAVDADPLAELVPACDALDAAAELGTTTLASDVVNLRAQRPKAQNPLRQSDACVQECSRGHGAQAPPHWPGEQADAGWHTPPRQDLETQSVAAEQRANTEQRRAVPQTAPQSRSASLPSCQIPSKHDPVPQVPRLAPENAKRHSPEAHCEA